MRKVIIREPLSGASFVTKPVASYMGEKGFIRDLRSRASFVTRPVAGYMGDGYH